MANINDFEIGQTNHAIKKQGVKASYQISKVIPQTGGQSLAAFTTTAPETVFELPPRVLNLARTHLKANISMANPGGTKFNWAFADCLACIDGIDLVSRGGVFLCNLSNVAEYTKLSFKDVKASDVPYHERSGEIYGTKSSTTAALNERHNATPSNSPDETQYFTVGAAVNTAMDLELDLPLSKIKNTIFACDKDLFFNEVMLLKIRWNSVEKWGALATAATTTTTGAAAYASAITITKLALYVALEDNPILVEGIMEAVAQNRFSIALPWVYHFHNVPDPTGAGGVQSITVRLNRSQGAYLKKVLHAVFPATRTEFARYSLNNTSKNTVTYYFTSIDNMRRQQFNVVVADEDDWTMHKDYYKGKLIPTIGAYRYNWHVVDNFDFLEGDVEDPMCVASGLPLNQEHSWNIQLNTGTVAYNHFTFVCTLRNLIVTNNGLVVQ